MSKLSILDPITRLGITNAKWGNCGFTSSLSAMYDLNQGVRGQVINGSSGYRMLAEIKTYLSMLKTVSLSLLADIRNFTRWFGPPSTLAGPPRPFASTTRPVRRRPERPVQAPQSSFPSARQPARGR